MPALTQSLALGVGVAGALVQIDPKYVRFVEGVSASEGRDDEFRGDVPPGQIDFYLENQDGRFTPDNLTAALAAGYFTALTEGSRVSWQRGTKLWSGTIRGFSFAGTELDWGILHVTADDMLGNAARHPMGDTAGLIRAAGPYYWWPMTDAVGGSAAASGIPGGSALPPGTGTLTFGAAAVSGVDTTQLTFSDPAGISSSSLSTIAPDTVVTSTTTLGTWGFWLTPNSPDQTLLTVSYGRFGVTSGTDTFFLGATPFGGPLTATTSTSGLGFQYGQTVAAGQPHYFSADVSVASVGTTRNLTVAAYMDGVAIAAPTIIGSYVGAAPTAANVSPTGVRLSFTILSALATASSTVGHLTYSPLPIHLETLHGSTPATRLAAIAAAVPEITLDTLPALSTTNLGAQGYSGSALDALGTVMQGEQGAIYTATTGTLTSPVQKVVIRERVRPPASTITSANSFDANTELIGVPQFVRDLTNLVSTETASGPTQTATYTDSTLTARAGSKSGSDTLPIRDYIDLYNWATDRVSRGANTRLRAIAINIDALTVYPDRTTDLLALKQGDRIRVTNIPSTSLGFTTWDGWIIGIREHHARDENVFSFMVAPTLPDTAIYDTDRAAAGGILSLTAAINAAVTSISVTSTGALFTTAGGDFPQTIRIDNEVLTVTAVAGAASPQTFTVTRGSTDPLTGLATTAAAHVISSNVELAAPALYAF